MALLRAHVQPAKFPWAFSRDTNSCRHGFTKPDTSHSLAFVNKTSAFMSHLLSSCFFFSPFFYPKKGRRCSSPAVADIWSRRSFQRPVSTACRRHLSPSWLAIPHRSTNRSPNQSANLIEKYEFTVATSCHHGICFLAFAFRLLCSSAGWRGWKRSRCLVFAEVVETTAQLSCTDSSRSGGREGVPKNIAGWAWVPEPRVRYGARIWPFLLSSPEPCGPGVGGDQSQMGNSVRTGLARSVVRGAEVQNAM